MRKHQKRSPTNISLISIKAQEIKVMLHGIISNMFSVRNKHVTQAYNNNNNNNNNNNK